MSQIISEIAKIEISDTSLQRLDIGNVYQNFSKNYQKLDGLKKFRTEYDEQNAIMRWWHNDKLQDAQLDSAEVQAEFSKTIGQLMVLNILQAKQLSEQQAALNEQQDKLKSLAEDIAEHTDKVQNHNRLLAERSEKLEALVHEYFELKGFEILIEDSAQRLVTIANDVKATKEQLLQEFAISEKNVQANCEEIASKICAQQQQINLSTQTQFQNRVFKKIWLITASTVIATSVALFGLVYLCR